MAPLFRPLVLAALAALASPAGAGPFAGADLAAGEKLHAERCVECHARRFGGEDGSGIYTRADRRVTSADALVRQIATCTAMLKFDFLPEDERNLAGYLNEQYYHFK